MYCWKAPLRRELCNLSSLSSAERVRENHERDRPGRLLGGLRRCRAQRNNDVDLQTDQGGREGGMPIILALGPSGLDGDVLTVHIAQLAQALAEGLETALSERVRGGARV